jgi:hypothetical protein
MNMLDTKLWDKIEKQKSITELWDLLKNKENKNYLCYFYSKDENRNSIHSNIKSILHIKNLISDINNYLVNCEEKRISNEL